MKEILIASDHAGFKLKNFLKSNLEQLNFEVIDLGCDSAEESVDYPDFAQNLGERISTTKGQFGILVCGSGVGISIAANRQKHIRAALCHNEEYAKLARQHNDANVICLGARMLSKQEALAIVKVFLSTEFEGGRHEGRVAKLSQ